MTFGKLFLELPREPENIELVSPPKQPSHNGNSDAPGLDLVEGLELGYGDKDDNGLLATTDINLPGSRDLQRVEFSLELGDIIFEINQSLGNLDFGLIWRCSGCICCAEDFVLEGHVETLGKCGSSVHLNHQIPIHRS